jgi:putative DNA primase/helicase
LALKFAKRYAQDLRFTITTGQWHIWNGRFWEEASCSQITDFARRICREESAACKDPRLKRRLASQATINAVERLARTDRRFAARADQWDIDEWLLNTPVGVIDLRTGILRLGDRRDHITKSTAAGPGGDCPLWLQFLARATKQDQELQHFLQRMCGYALTGTTQEQVLFFLYGTGANGKSVFLNTILGLMGEYAKISPIGSFTASRSERHPTDLAGLKGARLVVAIETEEGKYWDEAKIKAITGGDPLAARKMRQDFSEFKPQFKLAIAGNHMPEIRTVDEAMRRRVHLVPFTCLIPEAERDHRLCEKLRAEWPSILQWMVEGCLAWQKEGLNPPKVVRDATKHYLHAEDMVQQWLDDCCRVEPMAFSSTSELYKSFCVWWFSANNKPPISMKAFSQKLESCGLKYERTSRRRGYAGIALVTDMTDFDQYDSPQTIKIN